MRNFKTVSASNTLNKHIDLHLERASRQYIPKSETSPPDAHLLAMMVCTTKVRYFLLVTPLKHLSIQRLVGQRPNKTTSGTRTSRHEVGKRNFLLNAPEHDGDISEKLSEYVSSNLDICKLSNGTDRRSCMEFNYYLSRIPAVVSLFEWRVGDIARAASCTANCPNMVMVRLWGK